MPDSLANILDNFRYPFIFTYVFGNNYRALLASIEFEDICMMIEVSDKMKSFIFFSDWALTNFYKGLWTSKRIMHFAYLGTLAYSQATGKRIKVETKGPKLL